MLKRYNLGSKYSSAHTNSNSSLIAFFRREIITWRPGRYCNCTALVFFASLQTSFQYLPDSWGNICFIDVLVLNIQQRFVISRSIFARILNCAWLIDGFRIYDRSYCTLIQLVTTVQNPLYHTLCLLFSLILDRQTPSILIQPVLNPRYAAPGRPQQKTPFPNNTYIL
jgi:hypothetical protein